jgi:transcriptional regulator
MYVPTHFEESRPELLRDLIARHPLGTLVTLGSTGLNANHIPFELIAGAGRRGILQGHVARSNQVWKDFDPKVEALVIFQGPQAYITPTWYATKPETGKVVPTWNYCTVHATGPLRIMDDAVWLREFVSRLTDRFETGRHQPWKMTDAPPDYIEKQLAAIVGIEIPITRLVGKWKASQNRPDSDRAGVVSGLQGEGQPEASAMADVVHQHGRRPAN